MRAKMKKIMAYVLTCAIVISPFLGIGNLEAGAEENSSPKIDEPQQEGLLIGNCAWDGESACFSNDIDMYSTSLDVSIYDYNWIALGIPGDEECPVVPIGSVSANQINIRNDAQNEPLTGEALSDTVEIHTTYGNYDKGRFSVFAEEYPEDDKLPEGVVVLRFKKTGKYMLSYGKVGTVCISVQYPDIAACKKPGSIGDDLKEKDFFDTPTFVDFGGCYEKTLYINSYQYKTDNYKREVKINRVGKPTYTNDPDDMDDIIDIGKDIFSSTVTDDGKSAKLHTSQQMYTYDGIFYVKVEYTVTESEWDSENKTWKNKAAEDKIQTIGFCIPATDFVNIHDETDVVRYSGFFINQEQFEEELEPDSLPYNDDKILIANEDGRGYNKSYLDAEARGKMPVFRYESDTIQGVIDGLLKAAAICEDGGSVKAENCGFDETAYLMDIINSGYIAIVLASDDRELYRDSEKKAITEEITNTSGLKGIAYWGSTYGPSIRVNVCKSDPSGYACDLKFYGDIGDTLTLGYPVLTQGEIEDGTTCAAVTLIEGSALEREYVPSTKDKERQIIKVEDYDFSPDGSYVIAHEKDDLLAEICNEGKEQGKRQEDENYSYSVKTCSIKVKTEAEGHIEQKELLKIEEPDYNALSELSEEQIEAIENGKELTIKMEADKVDEKRATGDTKTSIDLIKQTLNTTQQQGVTFSTSLVSYIDIVVNAVVEGINKKTPITETAGYMVICAPVPATFDGVADKDISLVRSHKDSKGQFSTDIFKYAGGRDSIRGKESLNVFEVENVNGKRMMRFATDRFSTFAIVKSEKIESTEIDEVTGRPVYYYDFSKVTWDYTEPFTYDGKEKTVKLRNVPDGVKVTYTDNVKTQAGTYTSVAELSLDDSVDDTYATCVYKLPATMNFNSTVSVKDNKPYINWEIRKADSQGRSDAGTGDAGTKDQKQSVKVSSIKLSGISHKIAAGKSIKLTAEILPENADDQSLIWSSSDQKIATVDQKGVVKVSKKAGGKKVTITAQAADGSGVRATYKITVMKKAVKKLKLKGKKKRKVKAGKSVKLTAVVSAPKGANTKLKWTSSDPEIAKVNGKGKVKIAKKAPKNKKVKITVMTTDGSNKKQTVTITVK